MTVLDATKNFFSTAIDDFITWNKGGFDHFVNVASDENGNFSPTNIPGNLAGVTQVVDYLSPVTLNYDAATAVMQAHPQRDSLGYWWSAGIKTITGAIRLPIGAATSALDTGLYAANPVMLASDIAEEPLGLNDHNYPGELGAKGLLEYTGRYMSGPLGLGFVAYDILGEDMTPEHAWIKHCLGVVGIDIDSKETDWVQKYAIPAASFGLAVLGPHAMMKEVDPNIRLKAPELPGRCANIDPATVDLSGNRVRTFLQRGGRSLAGANLAGADMHGLRLSMPEISLNNANLAGADMRGIVPPDNSLYWHTVDWTTPILDGPVVQSLLRKGVDPNALIIPGRDLASLDLRDFWLPRSSRGVSYRGVRLTGDQAISIAKEGGSLVGADLRGADFRGRNLNGVDLSETRLEGADFGRRPIIDEEWSLVPFEDVPSEPIPTKLTGTIFTGATVDSTTIFPEGFQPQVTAPSLLARLMDSTRRVLGNK